MVAAPRTARAVATQPSATCCEPRVEEEEREVVRPTRSRNVDGWLPVRTTRVCGQAVGLGYLRVRPNAGDLGVWHGWWAAERGGWSSSLDRGRARGPNDHDGGSGGGGGGGGEAGGG